MFIPKINGNKGGCPKKIVESMDFVQTCCRPPPRSPLKLAPKIGINHPRPSPDVYFNTTKMNTKKVWIRGLTPVSAKSGNPRFRQSKA